MDIGYWGLLVICVKGESKLCGEKPTQPQTIYRLLLVTVSYVFVPEQPDFGLHDSSTQATSPFFHNALLPLSLLSPNLYPLLSDTLLALPQIPVEACEHPRLQQRHLAQPRLARRGRNQCVVS
jgi:hypothetical protein